MKIRPKSSKTPFGEEDVDNLIANYGRTPKDDARIDKICTIASQRIKMPKDIPMISEEDIQKTVDLVDKKVKLDTDENAD